MKVLDHTLPSPAENLACDEALLDAAEAGEGEEVLRFWESPNHFVVVGYANKVAAETNVTVCEARGIPIFRRCSGGGTVVQGPGCLNYALVLRIKEAGPTRNISAANHFIMERNREAIASTTCNLQFTVQFLGHTDLTIDGLKFSGNSQRRRKGFLLFHGTFLLNFDLPLVSLLLPMPSLQPNYRASRVHGEFITNLPTTSSAVKQALRCAWDGNEELKSIPARAIKSLVDEKYSTAAWNRKF